MLYARFENDTSVATSTLPDPLAPHAWHAVPEELGDVGRFARDAEGNIRALGPDELQREVEHLGSQALAAQVRNERNLRLERTDYRMLADLWEATPAQERARLAAYRQALRDVPQQADFPHAVQWPASV